MKLSNFLIYSLFIIAAFTSCSEEVVLTGEEEKSVEIILNIPDVGDISGSFSHLDSRAVDMEGEFSFSNIYLVAIEFPNVDEPDKANNFRIISLREKETGTGNYNNGGGYRDYKISFTPGYYKFYVVANLDRYLHETGHKNTMEIEDETTLNNIINNFSPNTQIIKGHLPMASLNTDINSNGYNYLETGRSYTITAPMKVLCAKVRYTILFDAREGGFSEEFGDERVRFDVSDFERPYASWTGPKNFLDSYKDFTGSIKNNSFDNNAADWTNTITQKGFGFSTGSTFSNGVACFSYCNFNFQQSLKGMPSGYYFLEVHGFYRQGEPQSSYNQRPGNRDTFPKIFINNQEISIHSIYDVNYGTVSSTFWGTTNNDYPKDINSAAKAFNENNYLNSLNYTHNETGDITIGIKDEYNVRDDLTCFSNFKLYYKPLEVEETTNEGTIALDRCTFDWNATKTPDYPQSKDTNDLTRWSGNDISIWYDLPNKAWQGITYLASNTENKPTLYFPYCYRDEERSRGEKSIVLFEKNGDSDPKENTPNGNTYYDKLINGLMYDIVVLVKKPEDIENEISLHVSVNDWNYHQEEEFWGEPGRNDDQRTFK